LLPSVQICTPPAHARQKARLRLAAGGDGAGSHVERTAQPWTRQARQRPENTWSRLMSAIRRDVCHVGWHVGRRHGGEAIARCLGRRAATASGEHLFTMLMSTWTAAMVFNYTTPQLSNASARSLCDAPPPHAGHPPTLGSTSTRGLPRRLSARRELSLLGRKKKDERVATVPAAHPRRNGDVPNGNGVRGPGSEHSECASHLEVLHIPTAWGCYRNIRGRDLNPPPPPPPQPPPHRPPTHQKIVREGPETDDLCAIEISDMSPLAQRCMPTGSWRPAVTSELDRGGKGARRPPAGRR
jgi:hypothetical protein